MAARDSAQQSSREPNEDGVDEVVSAAHLETEHLCQVMAQIVKAADVNPSSITRQSEKFNNQQGGGSNTIPLRPPTA